MGMTFSIILRSSPRFDLDIKIMISTHPVMVVLLMLETASHRCAWPVR
jgi:hypothetical protein